jgi:hypothetical protein
MGGGAQKEAKPLILMWFRGSFGSPRPSIPPIFVPHRKLIQERPVEPPILHQAVRIHARHPCRANRGKDALHHFVVG